MKVDNSTGLDTQDICKLFYRCIKEVERVEKPRVGFKTKKPYYHLKVMNNSYASFRGRAGLGACYMSIKIPARYQTDSLDNDNKQHLARLIIHEYYHNLGYRDFDRHNYKYDTTKTWDVSWVKDYPIRLKAIKPKVKVDLQAIRYDRAKSNLEKAETRLKRAKTLHKKWKDKVKYYEKALDKRGDFNGRKN